MKKYALVGVVLLGLCSVGHTTVWYVHPDSTMNCIDDCLDSCSVGDTVLVGPGTYFENIIWPTTQGIHLISEHGPDTTCIDGDSAGTVIAMSTAYDSTTVIQGFTICNGYHAWQQGGGIHCRNSASVSIIGNVIKLNFSEQCAGGIECWGYSSPLIYGNRITENTSAWGGGGIECYSYASPIIDSNTITDNIAPHGAGIGCYTFSSPTITNNNIQENEANVFGGGGIVCAHNTTAIITGNTITENTATSLGGGIMGRACVLTITNNTISDNSATVNGGGTYCDSSCTGIIDSNTVTGNASLKYGGGISCNYNSPPDIIGNTIIGNTADSCGAGISLDNSSPVIEGNYIASDTAGRYGGGIEVYRQSDPTITGNTITGNTATWGSGISCSVNCDPTIEGNEITDNISTDSGTIGSGGGILCINGSSPNINSNTISGNMTRYGSGISCQSASSPTIFDNTITGNAADSSGGGIDCWHACSPVIKHNVITNNTATLLGAGVSLYHYSSPDIDSCTIANNSNDGVLCDSNATPTINWCNIYGHTSYGVHNLDPGVTINAENNWWGDPSGPSGFGPGTGDSVSNYVDYDPWLADSVQGIGIEEIETEKPLCINLQVHPNPFRYFTKIRYMIHDTRYTILKPVLSIYDATGRLVKSFHHESCIMDRESAIRWDGTDNLNRRLSCGVYFVNLQAGDYMATEKVLIIR